MARYKSKMEKEYAAHLQTLLLTKQIWGWEYESVGFRLAENTFYYPDFLVAPLAGPVEFHETKGWDRQGKGKLKWKTTAEKYPCFVWKFITLEKGQWKIEIYGS